MNKIGQVERNLLLLIPVIILLVALIPLDNAVLTFLHTITCPTGVAGLNSVSVAHASDGELIGLSTGASAFDMASDRKDVSDKQHAMAFVAQGDTSNAVLAWENAVAADPSDAEPSIYLANQHVQVSGLPYFTLVLGATLTGDIGQGGRSILQGAYVAQLEYNQNARLSGKELLRLMIANAGSKSVNARAVACQIVQAAQVDKTIVGVMGWDYSGASLNAIPLLEQAHIPMLSATSSSDFLEKLSPYFWRIVPSDTAQAIDSAAYASKTLQSKRVAVFADPNDFYSKSLADDFIKNFTSSDQKIVAKESYTRGAKKEQDLLSHQIRDAFDKDNPDLIFLSGYSEDVRVMLTDLLQITKETPYKKFANLPVLGGDAFYVIARYPASIRPAFTNLHFTSFAAPDEWSYLCAHGQQHACQLPIFFNEYAQDFDPLKVQPSNTYGYNLPDANAMLGYDGIQTLITADQRASLQHPNPTPIDLQQALSTITGTRAIQGVSGQISFGPYGDPINKSVVIVNANLTTDTVHLFSIDVSNDFLTNPER